MVDLRRKTTKSSTGRGTNNGSLGSIGIYPAGSGTEKKLSTAKQKQIIELFFESLFEWFHLSEIVDFLDRSHLVESRLVSRCEDLSRGRSFSEMMAGVRFFRCSDDTAVSHELHVSFIELGENQCL